MFWKRKKPQVSDIKKYPLEMYKINIRPGDLIDLPTGQTGIIERVIIKDTYLYDIDAPDIFNVDWFEVLFFDNNGVPRNQIFKSAFVVKFLRKEKEGEQK